MRAAGRVYRYPLVRNVDDLINNTLPNDSAKRIVLRALPHGTIGDSKYQCKYTTTMFFFSSSTAFASSKLLSPWKA